MFFTYFSFFVDFIKVQRTYQNLTIFIEQLVYFVNCLICVCLFDKVKVGKLLYWGKDRYEDLEEEKNLKRKSV